MRKGTLVTAVAAVALMGVGATSAKAAPPVLGPARNTVDVRVVNRNASTINVYVKDVDGQAHYIGRVAPLGFGVLEIPGSITAKGDVKIQFFPTEPARSLFGADAGVVTSAVPLKMGDALNVFLGQNLLNTKVQRDKS